MTVYLCVNDFMTADTYYNNNYNNTTYNSTIIEISSFISLILHKFIIEYKLYKLFTSIKIFNRKI